MTRTLLVATTNPGKLREIRALLAGTGVELRTLADLPAMPAPEETGTTFGENARLKARYYSTRSGELTVAEDSGLVIDALGGEPGVHSARYLGDTASYQDRFNDIFRRLHAEPPARRTARFVCALAVADGDTNGGRADHGAPGRDGRVRLRSDFLLPAVRPYARRSHRRRQACGRPSWPGVPRVRSVAGRYAKRRTDQLFSVPRRAADALTSGT